VTRTGRIIQLRKRATGEVLLARLRWCASFGCRLRGLMLRRGLAPGEGLALVEARESRLDSSIHMLFMGFPLAVLWLDNELRVVDTRLARPWRPAYLPRKPARYIIEAAPALLDLVSIGDELEFTP
jgi:uncharacterized membrane protein (UPF0127 family)